MGTSSRSRVPRRLRPVATLVFAALAAVAAVGMNGCRTRDSERGALPHPASAAALPLPTKDEVALVEGRPFSVSAYLSLRASLKRPSDEDAFWVGTAAIALQQQAHARGQSLAANVAADVARFAIRDLGPLEAQDSLRAVFGAPHPASGTVKRQLDELVSKVFVQRNEALLSALKHP